MKYGIEVIRYTNDDVLKNLDMIKIDLEKRIHNKTQKILRPSGTSFTKGGIQEKIRSLRKIAGKELFTRKYMVIQTGCDNFCTFCLTVQARGRHKWRPMEEIIEEINTFVESGGKEVVFTGINLGAW